MAFVDFDNSDFLSNIGGLIPTKIQDRSGAIFYDSNKNLWSSSIYKGNAHLIRLYKNGVSKLSETMCNTAYVDYAKCPTQIVYHNNAVWWVYTYYDSAAYRLYLRVRKYNLATEAVSTTYTASLGADFIPTTGEIKSYTDLMYFPPDDKMWLSWQCSSKWGTSNQYTRGTNVYCLDSDGTLDHRAFTDYDYYSDPYYWWAQPVRVSVDGSYAYIAYVPASNDTRWSRMSKTTTDGSLTVISSNSDRIQITLPYGLHGRENSSAIRNGLETTAWTIGGGLTGIYLIKKIDSSDNFYLLPQFDTPAYRVWIYKLASAGTYTQLDSVLTEWISREPSPYLPGQCSYNDVGEWPTDPIGIGYNNKIYAFSIPDKDVT